MKIAVLGARGFIGSAIVSALESKHQVTPIHKDDWAAHRNTHFDMFVNANGNSRKFWAQANPYDDFLLSVRTVYESVRTFSFDRYILMSSFDVYADNHYGFNKQLAEKIVQHHCASWLILRCSAVIGKNMKKGVIRDVLDGQSLRVTADSMLQFISDDEIGSIVAHFCEGPHAGAIYDAGGIAPVRIGDLGRITGRAISYHPDAQEQHFNVDVAKLSGIYPLRSSEEYIKELLQ